MNREPENNELPGWFYLLIIVAVVSLAVWSVSGPPADDSMPRDEDEPIYRP